MFSIGELGKRTDTKVETIRYYEHVGLLAKPERSSGNYRLYAENDLNRLSFIRRARDLGFSLDDVKALMDLADQKDKSCSDVDTLARHHLQEVERKIGHLRALKKELGNLVERCEHGTVADCRIIDALKPARSVR